MGAGTAAAVTLALIVRKIEDPRGRILDRAKTPEVVRFAAAPGDAPASG